MKFFNQSDEWFVSQLGKPRIEVDGQILDAKMQFILEQSAPPERVEAAMETMFRYPVTRRFLRFGVEHGWSVYVRNSPLMRRRHDLKIPGRSGHEIPIRIYIPEHEEETPLPVLVYAHGGGFLFASIRAFDRIVRLMANEAKAIVVSVDYRLAPEAPYPAASDDGEDAYLWVLSHISEYGGDPMRVAVGGDSAGGHVAVNVSQRQVAGQGQVPYAQLLYYPALALPTEDRSYLLFGKGFGLDASFIRFIIPHVFPDQDMDDPSPDGMMSPLLAESLSGLPHTIIAISGFDILRDSCFRFVSKLRADGVPVSEYRCPSLPHSFLQYTAIISDAESVAVETARRLGALFRE